jgi:hypothetical protein
MMAASFLLALRHLARLPVKAGNSSSELSPIAPGGLHTSACFPVRRSSVVLVRAGFPIPILPRVVTELGSIFQLLLSNVRAESAERCVVAER